jgi:hypothetical protein
MPPGFPEAPLRHITHVPFTPSARIKAGHTQLLGVGVSPLVCVITLNHPAWETLPVAMLPPA